jgi:hypothetical protein
LGFAVSIWEERPDCKGLPGLEELFRRDVSLLIGLGVRRASNRQGQGAEQAPRAY